MDGRMDITCTEITTGKEKRMCQGPEAGKREENVMQLN